MPLFTPDARYLVVRDRLWRARNPALTEVERERWTRALMSARRAIRHALKSGDALAVTRARRDVQTAKVALGERGPVWWDDGSPDLNRRKIENTPYASWWQCVQQIRESILELLQQRAEGASICPSEVARDVMPVGWRTIMPLVRDVAREMADEGVVEVRQKGVRVSTEGPWRGPIRIVRGAVEAK